MAEDIPQEETAEKSSVTEQDAAPAPVKSGYLSDIKTKMETDSPQPVPTAPIEIAEGGQEPEGPSEDDKTIIAENIGATIIEAPDQALVTRYGADDPNAEPFNIGNIYEALPGTDITAGVSGTVIAVSDNMDERGLYVTIDAGNGVAVTYKNLSVANVQYGDTVNRNDVIGETGLKNDGQSFDEIARMDTVVVVDGHYVNPESVYGQDLNDDTIRQAVVEEARFAASEYTESPATEPYDLDFNTREELTGKNAPVAAAAASETEPLEVVVKYEDNKDTPPAEVVKPFPEHSAGDDYVYLVSVEPGEIGKPISIKGEGAPLKGDLPPGDTQTERDLRRIARDQDYQNQMQMSGGMVFLVAILNMMAGRDPSAVLSAFNPGASGAPSGASAVARDVFGVENPQTVIQSIDPNLKTKDLISNNGPSLLDPSLIKRMENDPVVRQMVKWTFDAAEHEGIDGALLANQFWQESRFKPNAVSYAGAVGVAQFMPHHQGKWGLESREDFYDPQKSIAAGARFMKHLTNEYGSQELALVAYNGGGKAIDYAKKHYQGPGEFGIEDWMDIVHQKRVAQGIGPRNAWRNQTFEYIEKIDSSFWSEDRREKALAMKGQPEQPTQVASAGKGLSGEFRKGGVAEGKPAENLTEKQILAAYDGKNAPDDAPETGTEEPEQDIALAENTPIPVKAPGMGVRT